MNKPTILTLTFLCFFLPILTIRMAFSDYYCDFTTESDSSSQKEDDERQLIVDENELSSRLSQKEDVQKQPLSKKELLNEAEYKRNCAYKSQLLQIGLRNTFAYEINDDEAFKRAVKFCEKESEKGDLKYLECLIYYYTRINKNPKKTIYWAYKDANEGGYYGMRALARAYLFGEGVLPIEEEYFKWLLLAKAAGCPESIDLLEQLAEGGKNLKLDNQFLLGFSLAKQWIKTHPNAFGISD